MHRRGTAGCGPASGKRDPSRARDPLPRGGGRARNAAPFRNEGQALQQDERLVAQAFLLGVAAGYAIAIPFGPIAILIVRTGVRQGLRAAAAAGAGTASADLIFATIAMLFGAAASTLLAPVLPAARLLAGAALAVIAVRGVLAAPQPNEREAAERRVGNTYALFLGLTMLNPPTVIYFVSLAVALPGVSADLASRAAFVLGAFLSSLS